MLRLIDEDSMQISGRLLIGKESVAGTEKGFRAFNPTTGETMEPEFSGASKAQVAEACELARGAFDAYRATSLEQRALFLEAIADAIMALGDELIDRAMAESGLPRPRLEGERGRTVGQLRLFATVVRDGMWLGPILDSALPDRKPLPRPDLRQRKIPLGPVAVFGASNFPLAFSVAGGDTASALAAGCPVVAKAHPSHPGTSELVGLAVQHAVASCGLPAGVFSMVTGASNEVGEALAAHPAITAVAFTGSRRGGLALASIAASRPVPVPMYAEMSSVNPVFLLPGSLSGDVSVLAQGFADSATLGAGQFCTQPGIVFALEGEAFDRFEAAAAEAIAAKGASTMLNPGIHAAYERGLSSIEGHDGVSEIARGKSEGSGKCGAVAGLFKTTSEKFLEDRRLSEENFGPSSLLVRCKSFEQMNALAESLEGQLTATLHMTAADTPQARSLVSILERKVGRILINGFPTGVEVSYAMVHGGPYPATSNDRHTSVGATAIDRFLRPVCYQNFPGELLPDALDDANTLNLWRLRDGKLKQE
ncbi:MAG: aldehyde dehydrogenase (NADP(+)) [Edaphobacter sp.]|uniref:aldehyde dehydrogenase (NADP(+)) n=1 Tax=Edaphobacter sp. TaxID=1934404 RepID=UPI00239B3FBF|nr:aldehyde dehydrogenase (NADP(+)) [Edaphobacter sp.]MDE1177464.1 aldehyde dehydrogenase (NADP(+)) [Edaphobacter sp.]